MSKFNRTRAKILSKKNIKGINQSTGFSGGTATVKGTGLTAETKEIIEVDLIENENNLDLNGSETIDGVTTSDGDIVIANAQSTASEIDIYVVDTSGDWELIDNEVSKIELIRIKKGSEANSLYTVKDGTSRNDGNLEFELVSILEPVETRIQVSETTVDEQTILNLDTIGDVTLAEVNDANKFIIPIDCVIQFITWDGFATGTNKGIEIRERLSNGNSYDLHAALDTSGWAASPPDLIYLKFDYQPINSFNNSIRLYPVTGYDLNSDGGEWLITLHYKVFDRKSI